MSLEIGKIIFTKADFERNDITVFRQALDALQRVPATAINHQVLSNETRDIRVLAKEEEMVFVNENDKKPFVGTTDQWGCVSLIAYTQDKKYYGLIHVNGSDLPIEPFLARFNGRGHIHVVIVGGRFDHGHWKDSCCNILKILGAMINSDQKFIVVSQRVVTANQMDEQEMMEFTRMTLLTNASVLYEKVMGAALPPYFFELSASHFLNKILPLFTVEYSTCADLFHLLMKVNTLVDEVDYHLIQLEKNDPMRLARFEKKLYALLHCLFSKEGVALLEQENIWLAVKGFPLLRHYVFNVITNEIYQINDKATEFDDERELYIYDDKPDSEYFVAFDNGHYVYPPLSDEIRESVIALKPMFERGILDESLVCEMEAAGLGIHDDAKQTAARVALRLADSFGPPKATTCQQLWSWRTILSDEPATPQKSLPFQPK